MSVLKPKYYRIDRAYQIEYAKKWNRENAERRAENKRKWMARPEVKERQKLLSTIYYFTHKRQAKKYRKLYQQRNREKINEYMKKYQSRKYKEDEKFRLEHLEKCRIYREKNREKIRERNRLSYKKRINS